VTWLQIVVLVVVFVVVAGALLMNVGYKKRDGAMDDWET